jgi:hypothetical protein
VRCAAHDTAAIAVAARGRCELVHAAAEASGCPRASLVLSGLTDLAAGIALCVACASRAHVAERGTR